MLISLHGMISQLRESFDTSRVHFFQLRDELFPDTLLQHLPIGVSEPVRYPELLDLAARQQLSVALFPDYQAMKEGPASLLRGPRHHDPDRLMHDLGEGTRISAKASGAEAWGDHGHRYSRALDGTQGGELASSAFFHELGESVPGAGRISDLGLLCLGLPAAYLEFMLARFGSFSPAKISPSRLLSISPLAVYPRTLTTNTSVGLIPC